MLLISAMVVMLTVLVVSVKLLVSARPVDDAALVQVVERQADLRAVEPGVLLRQAALAL